MIKLFVIGCMSRKKHENLTLIKNPIERARAVRLNWLVFKTFDSKFGRLYMGSYTYMGLGQNCRLTECNFVIMQKE